MWWRLEPDSFIEAVAKLQGAAEHVESRSSCLMCLVKSFLCVNVHCSMYCDKTEGVCGNALGSGVN